MSHETLGLSSMMSDLCSFSDLPAEQCGHCRPSPVEERARPDFSRRRRQAAKQKTSTIEAIYEGICASCREPIEEGDLIRPDGLGYWNHEGCDE